MPRKRGRYSRGSAAVAEATDAPDTPSSSSQRRSGSSRPQTSKTGQAARNFNRVQLEPTQDFEWKSPSGRTLFGSVDRILGTQRQAALFQYLDADKSSFANLTAYAVSAATPTAEQTAYASLMTNLMTQIVTKTQATDRPWPVDAVPSVSVAYFMQHLAGVMIRLRTFGKIVNTPVRGRVHEAIALAISRHTSYMDTLYKIALTKANFPAGWYRLVESFDPWISDVDGTIMGYNMGWFSTETRTNIDQWFDQAEILTSLQFCETILNLFTAGADQIAMTRLLKQVYPAQTSWPVGQLEPDAEKTVQWWTTGVRSDDPGGVDLAYPALDAQDDVVEVYSATGQFSEFAPTLWRPAVMHDKRDWTAANNNYYGAYLNTVDVSPFETSIIGYYDNAGTVAVKYQVMNTSNTGVNQIDSITYRHPYGAKVLAYLITNNWSGYKTPAPFSFDITKRELWLESTDWVKREFGLGSQV